MKEILFWTSHKQYSSDLAEVIRLFFADAHVSLADKREDAWLRHDLRFESGCWRNTAECGGVVSENIFSVQSDDFLILKRQQKRYAKLCVYGAFCTH